MRYGAMCSSQHYIRYVFLACAILIHSSVLFQTARAGEKGTLSALVENDYFAQRDRNYTNGLRVSYVTPVIDVSAFEKRLLGKDSGATKYRRSYSVGQALYTPDEIFTSEPQPDDHPYAGHLFGEYALISERDKSIEIVTLEFGLVGP